jgi:LysR family glycine cleavage system transcriptional activator
VSAKPMMSQINCFAGVHSVVTGADTDRRRWTATGGLTNPLAAQKFSGREEIHAIDAVVAGQGIAIYSDIVVSQELKNGALVKAHPLSLQGYGFYLVSMHHSARAATIESFSTWMRSVI